MRKSEIQWNVLPQYIAAEVVVSDDAVVPTVLIAFGFSGEDLLWVTARGNVVTRGQVKPQIRGLLPSKEYR